MKKSWLLFGSLFCCPQAVLRLWLRPLLLLCCDDIWLQQHGPHTSYVTEPTTTTAAGGHTCKCTSMERSVSQWQPHAHVFNLGALDAASLFMFCQETTVLTALPQSKGGDVGQNAFTNAWEKQLMASSRRIFCSRGRSPHFYMSWGGKSLTVNYWALDQDMMSLQVSTGLIYQLLFLSCTSLNQWFHLILKWYSPSWLSHPTICPHDNRCQKCWKAMKE